MVEIITFKLPYPPSVNHYWGHRGARWFIKKAGLEFRKAVAEAVKGIPKISSFIGVRVFVKHPDKRKRDVCNLEKALMDALQHAGLIDDDYQVDDFRIFRVRDDRLDGYPIVIQTNGEIAVHITKYLGFKKEFVKRSLKGEK